MKGLIKTAIIVGFVLTANVTAYSQDIIITKKSEKITAKVTEIEENTVKYKQYEHQDGPTYTIKKADVASIVYENGRVEVFEANNETAKPAVEQSVIEDSKKNSVVQKPEKQRRCYLSLGFSVFIVHDEPFFGGDFSFGFFVTPKNLLTIEFGGGSGGSEKIDSYSYTYYTKNDNGQITSTETKHDGEVSYGYSFFEVMLSYNRIFNLSEKWKLRLGPSIGMLSLSGSDSYSPTYYKNAKIEGLPESKSESKAAFMGGVNVGVQWNFSKRWFLDMNYRFSLNSPVEFPNRTLSVLGRSLTIDSKEFGIIGNRITLAIGVKL